MYKSVNSNNIVKSMIHHHVVCRPGEKFGSGYYIHQYNKEDLLVFPIGLYKSYRKKSIIPLDICGLFNISQNCN